MMIAKTQTCKTLQGSCIAQEVIIISYLVDLLDKLCSTGNNAPNRIIDNCNESS